MAFFNYMAWYVSDAEDLVSSLKVDMVNFNISYETASKIKRELEYKYNRDNDYKYAYCYICHKISKFESSNFSKIVNLLIELTNDGYIPAYNLLGNAYYYGLGVNKSEMVAESYYNKAHELGYAIATYNLALHNASKNNNTKCRYYLEQAIKKGYAPAIYTKGYGYHFGKYGYAIDKYKALALYEEAANKGYPKSQYFAGVMYRGGIGCSVNHQKAFMYLEKAAMFDEPDAKFLVGKYYYDGEHVGKHYYKAFYFFEEAVKQGHVGAMAYLGGCYLQGFGCDVDRVKASKYIKEAASKGDELAKNLLKYL